MNSHKFREPTVVTVNPQQLARVIGVAILVFVVVLLGSASTYVVQPGFRGVAVTLGSVSPDFKKEGFGLKQPFVTHIEQLSIRQQTRPMPAECYSSDLQQVRMEVHVLYRIPEHSVVKIFQDFAGEPFDNLIAPRIQEAIEFARELKLRKIGLASCVALINELGLVSELFIGAGFEVVSAACQIGRVSPEARGVPLEVRDRRGATCNPIAQAEILNSQQTQLNFIIGLCLGHDILFNRYSKAPVSTLIVKDRVTGHNPAVALYSSFHRRTLWKTYCNKDID